MTAKKNSITVYVLSCVIVIQLAIIINLLLREQKKTIVIVQNIEQINNDSIEIATKTEEFKLVGEELKKLKEQMLTMGMADDSIGSELDDLLEALWNVEMGGAIDIDALNSKIASAKKLLVIKDLQIKKLKEESDSLTFEEKLLKSAKAAQIDQISEMLNDTRKLSAKVLVAARVKAENIEVTGYTKKGKVINSDSFKPKALGKISISFNLQENKFTKINADLSLRLRIIERGPIVHFDASEGGGYFTSSDGLELAYTAKQSLPFDNTKQLVTFVYEYKKEYNSGIYKVELYAENYSIGEAQFKVK